MDSHFESVMAQEDRLCDGDVSSILVLLGQVSAGLAAESADGWLVISSVSSASSQAPAFGEAERCPGLQVATTLGAEDFEKCRRMDGNKDTSFENTSSCLYRAL